MPNKFKKRKKASHTLKFSNSYDISQQASNTNNIQASSAGVNNVNNAKIERENVVPLFPSVTPWIVVVVTLTIRVYYVTNPANWWVLHPDEVFQSMDVAHSETYGFAFRPYEYIPPAKGDNLSHYQVRETTLGMNALRSPIYPQLLALTASFSFWLGLKIHPFMLWRIVHVVVTSSLPLAASFFVKASGQSSDTVALASILIGASAHLNIFGTHTIINSFLSPFFFLALSRLLVLLATVNKMKENDVPSLKLGKPQGGQSCEYSSPSKNHLFNCDQHNNENCLQSQESCMTKIRNASRSMSLEGISSEDTLLSTKTIDNVVDHDLTLKQKDRNSVSSDSGFDNCSSSTSSISLNECHSDDDENLNNATKEIPIDVRLYSEIKTENIESEADQGYLNGMSGTSWTNLQIRAQKFSVYLNRPVKMTNGSTPKWDSSDLIPSMHFFSSMKLSSCNPLVSSAARDFGAGLLLGLSMYIRPDLCIFVTMVILANTNPVTLLFSVVKYRLLGTILAGLFIGIVLGTVDDFYFYQEFLISPWQWFRFNVLSNLASNLYGTSSAAFYVLSIFYGDPCLYIMSVIFVITVIHSIYVSLGFNRGQGQTLKSHNKLNRQKDLNNHLKQISNEKSKICKEAKNSLTINRSYSYMLIMYVIIYSLFGHKEQRFMHDALVLYFITMSSILIDGIRLISSSILNKRIILYMLTLMFSVGQWHIMPSKNNSGVNQCLYFVSKQDDVKGLFLEAQFPYTFSYTALHRDIPLLTILNKEFVEFDDTSIVTSNRTCFIQREKCKASYVSLSSVSNVIHISNSHGIVTHLLQRSDVYNYAIVRSSKKFFSPAYKPIFKTDMYTVWRFTGRIEHRKHVQQVLSEMMLKRGQAAHLQYEAEVLKQLGNYWMAVSRFRRTLKQSIARPKLLASMLYCLQRLGLRHEATHVFKECLKESDKEECSNGDKVRVPQLGFGKLV